MKQDVEYKHHFRYINNKFVFNRPDMWQAEREGFDSKKVYYITIGEKEEEVSVSQRGFYYGGIIRAECMNSNAFFGLTDKEIHQILFEHLRSYEKTFVDKNGNEITKTFTEDFKSYGKTKMSKYIDDVINFLANDIGIIVKDPGDYKLNKYEKRI